MILHVAVPMDKRIWSSWCGLCIALGAAANDADPAVALAQAQCAGREPPPAVSPVGARRHREQHGRRVGWQQEYRDDAGNVYTVERIAPRDLLRGIRVEVRDPRGQPRRHLTFGADCSLRSLRHIRAAPPLGEVLEVLDPDTGVVLRNEAMNPPIPDAAAPGGVRVALVDSGVNYLLPHIAPRLARDQNGSALGRDFWDLDERPFDANPAGSVFFPQRHGTRTASLLLAEAPHAALVPYRYPRPDMSRMSELIEHAAGNGVYIVAMPIGSRSENDWAAFADAAQRHPEMLFIVSAGNEGRNIDLYPSYPAVLRLENMVVVTSADGWGRPAEGTNWGPVSVDLMLPAERRMTVDFDGLRKPVSGSSYAVARLAALVARVAEEHPEWRAPELMRAVFDGAVAEGTTTDVRVGLIADPLVRPGEVTLLESTHVPLAKDTAAALGLELDVALLAGSGWTADRAGDMLRQASDILRQCNIAVTAANIQRLAVDERLLDFAAGTAKTLTDQAPMRRPAVFLVRDTLRNPAFEAEAFGTANTPVQIWLRSSVWMIAAVKDPGIALAHELAHVLSNSGAHVADPGNLMHERTTPGAIALGPAQCAALRTGATRQGLARELERH